MIAPIELSPADKQLWYKANEKLAVKVEAYLASHSPEPLANHVSSLTLVCEGLGLDADTLAKLQERAASLDDKDREKTDQLREEARLNSSSEVLGIRQALLDCPKDLIDNLTLLELQSCCELGNVKSFWAKLKPFLKDW